ncbi:MAG: HEAT repeat domain-containing protein [Planctomycetes bacterium]|nr:HEAT repeat domain-containing protein [Planctomycetota bacterium]
MIRRRSLCLLAFAAAFLTTPARAQTEDFQAAVEALSRGANEEALSLLQKVLNADPSNEAAYELWTNTENKVWLKLLTQGGEIELVARELVEKAKLGRKQRQNNPDAIRELTKQLANDDVLARTKVVNQLASDYGEFAVPILIYSLADGADANRGGNVIRALTHMGSDVLAPLVECFDATDAVLRRNVAITLGYMKDARSLPALARAAAGDADAGVRNAASQALARMGPSGDAGQLYLTQGDAFYREDPTVLAPYQYSDVVWHWEGNGLVAVEVPRFLYAPEMAKKAYYRALALSNDPGTALSGIARCAVTEIGRLDEWQAAGQDVGGWGERLKNDELAAQLAGPDALDNALGVALSKDDWIAASGLCRLLASSGKSATANLKAALTASKSGSVQGEAAVALASIAYRLREAADADTVAALTTAASTEVLRIGAVIGGDEASGRALAAQLSDLGYHTNWWSTGIRGLVSLRSLPGVDLIVVADKLSDLTARQVVNELRSDPRLAKTQIYVRTSSADADASVYGDKVNGLLGPGADIAATAEAAAKEPLNRDREEALALAARAAGALHKLASGAKTDVAGAGEVLAATLANRPDAVVAPALSVLEFVGGASHVERIAGVLSNGERSEPVRVHAAHALAGIFSRTGSADAGIIKVLQDVAMKDASFDVRAATAGALGRLNLAKDVRVELMRAILAR